MKKILLIILVFVGFNSIAQIEIEAKYDWVTDTTLWINIQTVNAVKGNDEVVDTIEYIFNSVPDMFNDVRINDNYVYNNDSTVRWINTFRRRLVVYRSRKAEVQIYVRREKWVQIPPTNDELMTLYLLKAKELGVNNNAVFWNYPPVDSLKNPEKYITTSDSIQ